MKNRRLTVTVAAPALLILMALMSGWIQVSSRSTIRCGYNETLSDRGANITQLFTHEVDEIGLFDELEKELDILSSGQVEWPAEDRLSYTAERISSMRRILRRAHEESMDRMTCLVQIVNEEISR